MPDVLWRPVVNRTVEGMYRPILGAVLHHTVSSLDSAEAHFNDPASQASAHFGVGYDGQIRQWVNINDRAWHAAGVGYGANTEWVGIETESPAGGPDVWGPMTDAQLDAVAAIMVWLHETEAVPLRVCDFPQMGGLAYHSMNPPSWGITGCPGDARIAQRKTIIDRALGSKKEEDMPSYTVVSVRDDTGVEKEVGSIVDGVLRHGNAEVQRNVNGAFVTVQHDQYVVMTQADWLHAWETAAQGATIVDLDYAKFADAVTTGFKHAVGAP